MIDRRELCLLCKDSSERPKSCERDRIFEIAETSYRIGCEQSPMATLMVSENRNALTNNHASCPYSAKAIAANLRERTS